MKKFKNLFTLVAFLMAGAAFTSCVNDDESIIDQPEAQKTYTLMVEATKGADTRTLTESEGALTAAWNKDDEVKVFLGEKEVGTLKPTAAGATKLKGEVKYVSEKDELTLKFQSDADYTSQGGTLDYIDTHCSAAVATVTVDKIVGSDLYTSDATFLNQQSITKFTFNVAVKTVNMNDGINIYTISLDEASCVIYVALPPSEEALTYTFKAVDASGVSWVGDAPKKVKLDAGKFYTATITLKEYSMQDYERQDEQNW